MVWYEILIVLSTSSLVPSSLRIRLPISEAIISEVIIKRLRMQSGNRSAMQRRRRAGMRNRKQRKATPLEYHSTGSTDPHTKRTPMPLEQTCRELRGRILGSVRRGEWGISLLSRFWPYREAVYNAFSCAYRSSCRCSETLLPLWSRWTL